MQFKILGIIENRRFGDVGVTVMVRHRLAAQGNSRR